MREEGRTGPLQYRDCGGPENKPDTPKTLDHTRYRMTHVGLPPGHRVVAQTTPLELQHIRTYYHGRSASANGVQVQGDVHAGREYRYTNPLPARGKVGVALGTPMHATKHNTPSPSPRCAKIFFQDDCA